jgi:hypothetical protein
MLLSYFSCLHERYATLSVGRQTRCRAKTVDRGLTLGTPVRESATQTLHVIGSATSKLPCTLRDGLAAQPMIKHSALVKDVTDGALDSAGMRRDTSQRLLRLYPSGGRGCTRDNSALRIGLRGEFGKLQATDGSLATTSAKNTYQAILGPRRSQVEDTALSRYKS